MRARRRGAGAQDLGGEQASRGLTLHRSRYLRPPVPLAERNEAATLATHLSKALRTASGSSTESFSTAISIDGVAPALAPPAPLRQKQVHLLGATLLLGLLLDTNHSYHNSTSCSDRRE